MKLFENLKQSQSYIRTKKELIYLKRNLSTDKTKYDTKYLSVMFEKTKDKRAFAKGLFELFYNNNAKSKENYKNYENGEKVFELFYHKKPVFHSWRFEKEHLLLIGYRIYFGPAVDDYIDPCVKLNDFEVLKIESRADAYINEKLYNEKMNKAFGESYEIDCKNYKYNKMQKLRAKDDSEMYSGL